MVLLIESIILLLSLLLSYDILVKHLDLLSYWRLIAPLQHKLSIV